jgi:hypothetical protein
MNGVLTKGGKRYFMTLIDNSTRFFYIYLLKSKDEALHYFKIYKAEVENQLERKIKHLTSDRGGEYFSNTLDTFVRNTISFMRGHRLIHPNPMGLPKERTTHLTDLVNAMLETVGLRNGGVRRY